MDVTKKSSSTKNKYREDVVKSVKASLLMSQKLDYFAKRLPQHFKTPPNFSSMVMKSTSCEKCSSTSITYSSPCSNSFSFSTLSRFEHTIFEKFKSKKNLDRISCIRKISDEEKLKRSLRFSFNKDMKNFSYEKKLEKIENLSKNYEYSKHIVQIAKSNIVEGKKSHRESKLRLKFSKLEIRLKKGMLNDIKASWLTLVAAAGFAELMKTLIEKRKSLICKCRGYWKKAKVFIFAFRRFLRIVLNYRKAMRLKKAYSQVSELCKIKILQRNFSKTLIVNFFEFSIGKGILKGIVRTLCQRVALIQNSLKYCLAYRKKVYGALLEQWKIVESTISLSNIKKKGRKSIKNQIFISDESKLLYIRSYIKAKVKDYLKLLQEYKTSKQRSSQKPSQPDMLSLQFIQQATSQIQNSMSQKRLSIRRSIKIPK